MRKFLIAAGALALAGGDGLAWTVINHEGRDYVSFSDVAQFYRFPEHTRGIRTVSLRSERRRIRAVAEKNEIFINGVRVFTHFPIISDGERELISALDVTKILDPVLRPHQIENPHKIETVVLDPGHGGVDHGASNKYGTEKQFTLEVALPARDQLVRAGYKVVMTRTADVAVSLEERAAFANQFPNAVLVSIHFNTGGGRGVESYALTPAGVPSSAATENIDSTAEMRVFRGNGQDAKNVALAAAVHASLLSRVPTFDRGIRHSRFVVLREAMIPAVLIEAGFLSHPEDGMRIATPYFRQQLATAIVQAVQNFDAAMNFKAPNTGASFAVVGNSLPPHSEPITAPLSDVAPVAPEPPQKPSVSISGGE